MDIFYYHLDSKGTLRRDDVMQLEQLPDEVQIGDPTWFPNGVTRFGIDIILKQLAYGALEREYELESIRRERFPMLPSRYVSIFAWQSTKDLDRFRADFRLLGCGEKHGRIWKVKGKAVFRGDMDLFNVFRGDLEMRTAADYYWSQQASGDPLYEYLLEPPVTVLEEVHEVS